MILNPVTYEMKIAGYFLFLYEQTHTNKRLLKSLSWIRCLDQPEYCCAVLPYVVNTGTEHLCGEYCHSTGTDSWDMYSVSHTQSCVS